MNYIVGILFVVTCFGRWPILEFYVPDYAIDYWHELVLDIGSDLSDLFYAHEIKKIEKQLDGPGFYSFTANCTITDDDFCFEPESIVIKRVLIPLD